MAFQRVVIQAFLIFEFILIVFSFVLLGFAFYIIWKVPQFHANVNGLLGNIALAYLVLEIPALIRLCWCRFDPIYDRDIYYTNVIYRTLFCIRQVALNSYVLSYFSMAIERSIATVSLKNYENFKNFYFLLLALIIQWSVGFVIYRIFDDKEYGYLWEFIAIGIMVTSFGWIVVLHFLNKYRYHHRKIRVYSLRERFQLSENIRFLRMILWCSITALLGGVMTMIIFFVPYDKNDMLQRGLKDAIYQTSMVVLAIAVILAAILTNRTWRTKFFNILKQMKAHVAPWTKSDKENQNHRFYAPHIKTLSGKPMVYSVETERELYFRYLKERL